MSVPLCSPLLRLLGPLPSVTVINIKNMFEKHLYTVHNAVVAELLHCEGSMKSWAPIYTHELDFQTIVTLLQQSCQSTQRTWMLTNFSAVGGGGVGCWSDASDGTQNSPSDIPWECSLLCSLVAGRWQLGQHRPTQWWIPHPSTGLPIAANFDWAGTYYYSWRSYYYKLLAMNHLVSHSWQRGRR